MKKLKLADWCMILSIIPKTKVFLNIKIGFDNVILHSDKWIINMGIPVKTESYENNPALITKMRFNDNFLKKHLNLSTKDMKHVVIETPGYYKPIIEDYRKFLKIKNKKIYKKILKVKYCTFCTKCLKSKCSYNCFQYPFEDKYAFETLLTALKPKSYLK